MKQKWWIYYDPLYLPVSVVYSIFGDEDNAGSDLDSELGSGDNGFLNEDVEETAETTQDSEKYTEGGSYEQETVKAGGWVYSQFVLWKNFFDMAGEKNEQAEFEDITSTLATYIPYDIGLRLIPCYLNTKFQHLSS